MAQDVEFRLNTTARDGKWLRGSMLGQTVKIDPTQVREAVERSMQSGLSALRSNVSAAGVKTGRLRRSPGIVTRKYGGARRLVIVGLVGYKAGVAPHAKYLEFGTPPRGNRRPIAARRYAWLAYFHNREAMQSAAKSALEAIMEKAVQGAT